MTLLTRVVLLLAGALACAALAWLALTQGVRAPAGTAGVASAPDTAAASAPRGQPVGDGSGARVPVAGSPPLVATKPVTSSQPGPRLPVARPLPGPAGLVVPVAGVTVAQLADTFGDVRGSERRHEALDIMAPAGTPVLAVVDGHVEKLFDSERGGLTIYQFEPSGRYAYYYAHLQRYAAGLAEGQAVRQGQVIGYVGSTGNADPAAPHLHFAIFLLGPERAWYRGTPVNPYPLLGGR
jgi:murein DD-endopeptidase MepM/ murein hydrolase activator NlpD